jgi:prolipoprotein diacylglyceryltransferase
MKVGLSVTSLSVCLSIYLSVCPPLITLKRLVDFYEIWYGGNSIQGDLYAISIVIMIYIYIHTHTHTALNYIIR